MMKFSIILLCLSTRCFLQANVSMRWDRMKELLTEIQEDIVDTSSHLNIIFKYFKSGKDIPEEEKPHIFNILEQTRSIIEQKNLHKKLTDAIYIFSYYTLLKHAGFEIVEHSFQVGETDVTKWEARSLLRMMVDLRTVLPTNRVFLKAVNETAAYLLELENWMSLFTCFMNPKNDTTLNVSYIIPLFTELMYPYWVETFVQLVKEDGRLEKEFKRPLRSGTETDLFATNDDKDWWSAPIFGISFALHQIGDIREMDYTYYLVLRAMVQVANKGTEEAMKLNEIFWHTIKADEEEDRFYDDIFIQLKELVKADTILWEQIKDAEDELDASNLRQQRSILLEDLE